MKALHFEPVPEVNLLHVPGVFTEQGIFLDGSSFLFLLTGLSKKVTFLLATEILPSKCLLGI